MTPLHQFRYAKFNAIQIVTLWPLKEPRTDDMREMVDALRPTGEVRACRVEVRTIQVGQ